MYIILSFPLYLKRNVSHSRTVRILLRFWRFAVSFHIRSWADWILNNVSIPYWFTWIVSCWIPPQKNSRFQNIYSCSMPVAISQKTLPLSSKIYRTQLKIDLWSTLITVFWIRMDPGFFADPDPGFKSPDPSINKLMGSEWWFW